MTGNRVELFLDSGAFSAWSQGQDVDIQEYITFIKENEDCLDIYAVLDVIGNPQATWKNQMIMEDAGLHPLPVFHYGEADSWLERILKRGYDYIGLGGMVPITTNSLIYWLDHLFSQYLTDEKGLPKVKVHGFGLTSLPLMLRYPWFSVDSTSWVITGRLGSIYVPKWKGGKWIYNEPSWKIAVSARSPQNKDAGKHITTLKNEELAIFMNYIHEKGYKLGKSELKMMPQDYIPEKNEKWIQKKPTDKSSTRLLEVIVEPGICNKYEQRDEMNVIYFLDLEKSMPKWPWSFKKDRRIGLNIY